MIEGLPPVPAGDPAGLAMSSLGAPRADLYAISTAGPRQPMSPAGTKSRIGSWRP